MATNSGWATWRGRVTLAIGATLCAAGLSRAGVIEGQATYLPTGLYARCIVTNASKSDKTIQSEAINQDGSVYANFGPETVAPGATLVTYLLGNGGSFLRCRWTVEGSPAQYRASMCTTLTPGSACYVQVPAN